MLFACEAAQSRKHAWSFCGALSPGEMSIPVWVGVVVGEDGVLDQEPCTPDSSPSSSPAPRTAPGVNPAPLLPSKRHPLKHATIHENQAIFGFHAVVIFLKKYLHFMLGQSRPCLVHRPTNPDGRASSEPQNRHFPNRVLKNIVAQTIRPNPHFAFRSVFSHTI